MNAKIEKILKKYKKKLKLDHWKIELRLNTNLKYYAETTFYNFHDALVEVNPLMNKDTVVLENTIKHELLHIFFYEYTRKAEEAVKNPKQLIEKEERVVSRLADLI